MALTAATAGFVVVFDVAAEVEAGREEAEDDEVDGVAAANGAARSFVDATTVFVGAFAPAVASRDDCEAKVDAIKAAIQSGNYPVNPRQIAENFVSLEKMIQG